MDPWGRKMSKSLGNGIDADSVLECGAGGRTGSWKVKGLDGKTKQFKANKIGSECFQIVIFLYKKQTRIGTKLTNAHIDRSSYLIWKRINFIIQFFR